MGISKREIRCKIGEIQHLCHELLTLMADSSISIILDEIQEEDHSIGMCIIERGDARHAKCFAAGLKEDKKAVSRALAEAMYAFPLKEVSEQRPKVNIYTDIPLNLLGGPGYDSMIGLSHLVTVTVNSLDKYHDQEFLKRERESGRGMNEINNNLRDSESGSSGERKEAS